MIQKTIMRVQQENITGKLTWLPLRWKPVRQRDPELIHFKSFQLQPRCCT